MLPLDHSGGRNLALKLVTSKKNNVLLQNLIRMEHFEICVLKLIKKIISPKLMVKLNLNAVYYF